jgi:FkbM family methyltransferase
LDFFAKVIGLLPRSWIKAASRAQWRNPTFKRAFDWAAGRMQSHDGVVQQGIGKGLKFNTGRSNPGYMLGTSEPEVQEALAMLLRSGMTFYDIGANVGFYSVIGSRLVGPAGRIIAFEPLPENAERATYNAHLNSFTNFIVRQEALGREDGEGHFFVSEEPTWGTLENGDNAPSRLAGRIPVPVRKLDSIVASGELPPPDLIKIDIEGGETHALEGAMETLRRFRPILMVELHGTNAGVAGILERANYATGTLGSRLSITESPWNAYVVAVPIEKPELLPLLERLCRPSGESISTTENLAH